jgi:Gluconate 2-dehydrogenase subunit 3
VPAGIGPATGEPNHTHDGTRMNHSHSRRTFLRNSGLGALSFYVGGTLLHLAPAQARERDLPLQVLSLHQAKMLEAFGEVLLPGSTAAGIAWYVDHQLNAAPVEQMLVLKYLRVEQPFTDFYAGGLAALDAHAVAAMGKPFPELTPEQQSEITGRIAQSNPDGWTGPPAPLFYFAVRNDALDVVYGTVKGIESLGLPYMAHIQPPSRWGE